MLLLLLFQVQRVLLRPKRPIRTLSLFAIDGTSTATVKATRGLSDLKHRLCHLADRDIPWVHPTCGPKSTLMLYQTPVHLQKATNGMSSLTIRATSGSIRMDASMTVATINMRIQPAQITAMIRARQLTTAPSTRMPCSIQTQQTTHRVHIHSRWPTSAARSPQPNGATQHTLLTMIRCRV